MLSTCQARCQESLGELEFGSTSMCMVHVQDGVSYRFLHFRRPRISFSRKTLRASRGLSRKGVLYCSERNLTHRFSLWSC